MKTRWNWYDCVATRRLLSTQRPLSTSVYKAHAVVRYNIFIVLNCSLLFLSTVFVVAGSFSGQCYCGIDFFSQLQSPSFSMSEDSACTVQPTCLDHSYSWASALAMLDMLEIAKTCGDGFQLGESKVS